MTAGEERDNRREEEREGSAIPPSSHRVPALLHYPSTLLPNEETEGGKGRGWREEHYY